MEHGNSSLVELLTEFIHQWQKNLKWAEKMIKNKY